MIIKTSELEGVALDWAVAKSVGVSVCIGVEYHTITFVPLGRPRSKHNSVSKYYLNRATGRGETEEWRPSTDWSQCGPLIERYKLTLYQVNGPAATVNDDTGEVDYDGRKMVCADGETILIAAMRAIVASELGDTVDVPEELLS